MRLGVPEFIKAKKSERSWAQFGGDIALRTTPRGILALLKGTLKGIDSLITFGTPNKYHSMPNAAKTATQAGGIAVAGAIAGAALPYISIGVLPAVGMLDGGITALSAVGVKLLLPKATALLSPEKEAKIDKAVLDKLAYIHSLGDKLCGKDQGVYAQQMDLYTDYAVKRERHKVTETLDKLSEPANKAQREQFFGPEHKESKIAMQVFNVLSRSHVEEIRDKALAVLAERVKDYSPTDTALIDQVRDYHTSREDSGAFVAILEGAKSLDRKNIHHMFGDRASSLIFVYNALLHDQEFSDRLITATEGVLKGDDTFAGLDAAQSKKIREIHNGAMKKTIGVRHSPITARDALIAKIEKLTRGIIKDVHSNASETASIPGFNPKLLLRGDFRFSLAEFFADMDSPKEDIKKEAMEKFLAARTILEFHKVKQLTKNRPDDVSIQSYSEQQAVMLRLVRDPSSLKIDDSKKTLQRNIDGFCKSPEGQKLIVDHSVQIASLHADHRNHLIDLAIKKWDETHSDPADKFSPVPKDQASSAFLDKQMTYSNELDSAARALMPELARLLGGGTPNHRNLAQSLELIAERPSAAESTEDLIKRVITTDPSIIKDLNSADADANTTAIFKLLVEISNTEIDSKLRNDAYSFVAQKLGSTQALKEPDLLALRSDSHVPGYNANVDGVKLAAVLEAKAKNGDAIAGAINTIIGAATLPNHLIELRSGDDNRINSAIVAISHDIVNNNPASRDLNKFLETNDPSIKWDIMRSAYGANAPDTCNFGDITRIANNLSGLERHSKKIDADIAKEVLEPVLSDLFIRTQTVNPQVDPRNMKSVRVQTEVREQNERKLKTLESEINTNITDAIKDLPTYEARVERAHLGRTKETIDSIFTKAIV